MTCLKVCEHVKVMLFSHEWQHCLYLSIAPTIFCSFYTGTYATAIRLKIAKTYQTHTKNAGIFNVLHSTTVSQLIVTQCCHCLWHGNWSTIFSLIIETKVVEGIFHHGMYACNISDNTISQYNDILFYWPYFHGSNNAPMYSHTLLCP